MRRKNLSLLASCVLHPKRFFFFLFHLTLTWRVRFPAWSSRVLNVTLRSACSCLDSDTPKMQFGTLVHRIVRTRQSIFRLKWPCIFWYAMHISVEKERSSLDNPQLLHPHTVHSFFWCLVLIKKKSVNLIQSTPLNMPAAFGHKTASIVDKPSSTYYVIQQIRDVS